MTRSAITLAENFASHLNRLEMTRAKMELLLFDGTIVRRDIEQVYEGLYLEAITSFENFLESLFIGLLVGKITHSSSSVVPRVVIKSYRVARDVAFGGQNYVDWFPYDNKTLRRAKAFFRNGMPFSKLTRAEMREIERFLCIRNAIAHKSKHAKRVFEDKVVAITSLPPRERTFAGFLRSVFRITPRQTQYEILISEMASIARSLCV
jgi:hypothetical protein